MAEHALAIQPESDTKPTKPGRNKGVPHLDDDDVVLVIRWHLQGKTQEWIASKLHPPRAQSTISDCIRKYAGDTTAEAKHIFRSQAAPMALKIVKEGRPSDLIKVQEGQNVLAQSVTAGLTIQIGIKDSDVSVNLSPPASQVIGESTQNP